ncbi:hypothetical protein JST97_36825 [bacterium]|nr:hypothetical protein [bacterium]
MKHFCLVLILMTALAVGAEEIKPAPIFGCIASWQETMKAICLYKDRTGTYPKNLATLHNRHIHCPVSGKEYSYKIDSDRQGFILYCPGNTHHADGAHRDHPWFSYKNAMEIR